MRQVGDLRPWEADIMQLGGQPGLHRDPSQPGLKKNCHAKRQGAEEIASIRARAQTKRLRS